MRTLGTSYILAPQQLVSCDTQSSGCGGGWPTWGFDYVMSAGGQEQESAYPYTSGTSGVTGKCSANAAKNVLSVSQYYQITAASASAIETAMASYVGSTGPLSICVDANNWRYIIPYSTSRIVTLPSSTPAHHPPPPPM